MGVCDAALGVNLGETAPSADLGAKGPPSPKRESRYLAVIEDET